MSADDPSLTRQDGIASRQGRVDYKSALPIYLSAQYLRANTQVTPQDPALRQCSGPVRLALRSHEHEEFLGPALDFSATPGYEICMAKRTKAASLRASQGQRTLNVAGLLLKQVGWSNIDIGRVSFDGSSIGRIAIGKVRGSVDYDGTLSDNTLVIQLAIDAGLGKHKNSSHTDDVSALEREISAACELTSNQEKTLRERLSRHFTSLSSAKTRARSLNPRIPPIRLPVPDMRVTQNRVPLVFDGLSFSNQQVGGELSITLPELRTDIRFDQITARVPSGPNPLVGSATARDVVADMTVSGNSAAVSLDQTFTIPRVSLADIKIAETITQQLHGGLSVQLGGISRRLELPLGWLPFVGAVSVWIEVGIQFSLDVKRWRTDTMRINATLSDISIENIRLRLRIQDLAIEGAGLSGLAIDSVSLPPRQGRRSADRHK